jgi:nucleoside-diphosphate-sugar epimerase
VARQWNAYGSIEKFDIKSHVISDMVVQAVDNNVIKLLTNGSESRKFIHLDDICDAYLILLNNHQGEIHDVCTKDYTSILFVASIIKDITGATIIRGEKEGVTPLVATLQEIPGWSPKVTIKDGVNNLISQYIALKKYL